MASSERRRHRSRPPLSAVLTLANAVMRMIGVLRADLLTSSRTLRPLIPGIFMSTTAASRSSSLMIFNAVVPSCGDDRLEPFSFQKRRERPPAVFLVIRDQNSIRNRLLGHHWKEPIAVDVVAWSRRFSTARTPLTGPSVG